MTHPYPNSHLPRFRLRNPVTLRYMHLCGKKESPDRTTNYAWSGTEQQARALKRQWVAAGREFHFVLTGMKEEKGRAHAEYL
jgi:hypothetical protein